MFYRQDDEVMANSMSPVELTQPPTPSKYTPSEPQDSQSALSLSLCVAAQEKKMRTKMNDNYAKGLDFLGQVPRPVPNGIQVFRSHNGHMLEGFTNPHTLPNPEKAKLLQKIAEHLQSVLNPKNLIPGRYEDLIKKRIKDFFNANPRAHTMLAY